MSDKAKYYAETKNNAGQWCPERYAEPPMVKQGRIVTTSGTGKRIRLLGEGYVVEINPGHLGLSLESLHARYSPDGRLQATGKGRHDVEI